MVHAAAVNEAVVAVYTDHACYTYAIDNTAPPGPHCGTQHLLTPQSLAMQRGRWTFSQLSSRTLSDSLHILGILRYETWSSRIARTSLPLRADAGASSIVRPSILHHL